MLQSSRVPQDTYLVSVGGDNPNVAVLQGSPGLGPPTWSAKGATTPMLQSSRVPQDTYLVSVGGDNPNVAVLQGSPGLGPPTWSAKGATTPMLQSSRVPQYSGHLPGQRRGRQPQCCSLPGFPRTTYLVSVGGDNPNVQSCRVPQDSGHLPGQRRGRQPQCCSLLGFPRTRATLYAVLPLAPLLHKPAQTNHPMYVYRHR